MSASQPTPIDPKSVQLAQVVPILGTLPPTLAALRVRLDGLAYLAMPYPSEQFDDLKLVSAPAIAIVPLSARTTMEQLMLAMQKYRDRFPNAKTTFIAVYAGKLTIPAPDLQRLGVRETFQSPFEDESLINKMFEISPVRVDQANLSLDQLVRINVVEIESIKRVPFDLFLYLPMNRKVILYFEKDSLLDEKTLKKFQEKRHVNLYIRRADIRTYQSFGRTLIAEQGEAEKKLGDVERGQKTAQRIAGMMGGFFSDEGYTEEDGQQQLENLKAFVKDMRTPGAKVNAELEASVAELASQKMTRASHTANVSAYCALFGSAVGLPDVDALKMGGLLHDIGMAKLPLELLDKDMQRMTPDELTKFKQHTLEGDAQLVLMKMPVSREVRDMVLFHHEHSDGSGFPYSKKADQIPPYAKVCAFADLFDTLTSVRSGYPQLTPVEAIRRIAGIDGSPASAIYDPVFHKPIVELFLGKGAADAPAAAPTPIAVPAAPAADIGKVQVAEAPATSGAERVRSITAPIVQLSRLMKTVEFAPPASIPAIKLPDPDAQAEVTAIAEQITKHFKKAK